MLDFCAPASSRAVLKRTRGHPLQVTASHLALGLLLCMLRGWKSRLDLWRMIRFEGVGSLAPFARAVLALDESTLDRLKRWLPHLRDLPKGHDGLLPGRIAGLFAVRTQLWQRIAVLDDAKANCKEYAREMLNGLEKGTLILFDRGYFAFAWFDDLVILP